VTFTLDDETVAQIRQLAARQRKPQSQVVREAIVAHAAHGDRLSEAERLRLLDALHRIAGQPPTRSARAVDEELTAVGRARRQGGRRSA
jgi:hypothetical protein